MDATRVLESIIDLKAEILAAGAGYHFKAEAARSEQEGVGTPDYEALFASNEGVKQPTVLAAGAGYHLKAEAARSEQEGVGTPDYEALFASNEGVK
ncbi:hypothetical protein, partial [Bacillus sp. ABP14]|uniref:hypothetical protein n=1 Tax=Bacillus sp. ABP14 TaxID=1892404 RepID=UPI00210627F1